MYPLQLPLSCYEAVKRRMSKDGKKLKQLLHYETFADVKYFSCFFFLSRSLFNWNGFIVLRCGKKLTCRFTFLFYFFPFAIPNHSHYSMPKAMYKLLWTRLALFCHHHLCAHTPESLTLKMKKLIPQRALDVASVPIFYGLKYDDLEHALLCHKIYIRNFILSKI